MKLEEGQYVRTNRDIFQITNNNVFIENKKQYIGTSGRYTCIEIETIKKVSDKLIDLIEKDDIVKVRIDNTFVNYFVVDAFEDDEENEILGIACYEDGMLNTISEYRPLNTLEILEVLTKECFEQMSYKVGD